MSMDLCYLNQDGDAESLVNMSNANWARFTNFVRTALETHKAVCEETVDNINLDPTGDANYDKWKADTAEAEKDELCNANVLLYDWNKTSAHEGGGVNMTQVLECMAVCLTDPNHVQYTGYIARIIAATAKVVDHGNPRVYWA